MRPVWTGVLAFGLVTIPVKLYSATETSHEVHFRLLNSETLRPIKEIRVDPETRREVPWEKVVHGVEYRKGEFVALSSRELESLPLPTAGAIDVLGFADAPAVDPLFFDKMYYVAPGQGGSKAYELFRRALENSGKVAIGKVAMRTREHLVSVDPQGAALVMRTLYYADEVRQPNQVPGMPANVRVHPNEEKMARQLMETMAVVFRPQEYRSEYKAALDKLVRAKAQGKVLPSPKPTAAKVVDLQEALRESLRRAQARAHPIRRRAAS